MPKCLIALLFIASLFPSLRLQAQASSLRQSYESYARAVEKSDFKEMLSYLSAEIVRQLEANSKPDEQKAAFKFLQQAHVPLANTKFLEEKISGNQATLHLATKKPQAGLLGRVEHQEAIVEGIKENGSWKIKQESWKTIKE